MAAYGLLASSSAAVVPSVILVHLLDDFGHFDTGFAGNTEARTPHLDALHASGIGLTRHYGFKFCSPSRSAFLSGRLPFHVNQGQPQSVLSTGGVDLRMTTIAEKLASTAGGAETHFYGKWHVGQRSRAHLPFARGFNVSLGYLTGAENHFTQVVADPQFGSKVDLWQNDAPAPNDVNGTYGTYIYASAGVAAIRKWAAAANEGRPHKFGLRAAPRRLFLFMAWQNTHAPLQVPTSYCYNATTTTLGVNGHCAAEAPPGWPPNAPKHSWCYCYDDENATKTRRGFGQVGFGKKNATFAGDNADRHTVEAMAAVLDEGIANMTSALKAVPGLWARTLIVVSSDNGGPVNAAQGSGNNYPLRGGKHTDFEGGVRLLAFVGGGVVPLQRRGSNFGGLIHLADWYVTFCALWGVDPYDERAHSVGLPPVDGVDIWPALMSGGGGGAGNESSPRLEVPISINQFGCFLPNGSLNKPCALIVEERDPAAMGGRRRLWKAVGGPQNGLGFWTGPRHPNATQYDPIDAGCPNGCLFEVGVSDPTEHFDLLHPTSSSRALSSLLSSSSSSLPNASILARWARMVTRMNELSLSAYSSNDTGAATECIADANYYKALWGCHRGPACFLPGETPPLPPNSTDPATGKATCSVHL